MVLSSSVVEQTTVNRLAIGSNPIWGERRKRKFKKKVNKIHFFYIFTDNDIYLFFFSFLK